MKLEAKNAMKSVKREGDVSKHEKHTQKRKKHNRFNITKITDKNELQIKSNKIKNTNENQLKLKETKNIENQKITSYKRKQENPVKSANANTPKLIVDKTRKSV